jgi:hypothetical protein
MIVRAVLTNPEVLERFDWFNDGINTINWLKWVVPDSDLISLMEERLRAFQEVFARRC